MFQKTACATFLKASQILYISSSRKIFTNILVLFLPIYVYIFQLSVQIMQIVVYWRNSDIFGGKSEPRKNYKKPEQEGFWKRNQRKSTTTS